LSSSKLNKRKFYDGDDVNNDGDDDDDDFHIKVIAKAFSNVNSFCIGPSHCNINPDVIQIVITDLFSHRR